MGLDGDPGLIRLWVKGDWLVCNDVQKTYLFAHSVHLARPYTGVNYATDAVYVHTVASSLWF